MTRTRPPLRMPEKRSQDAEAWVQAGSAKETPPPAPETPQRPLGGKLARLNVELPPDLHRQFKTACAAEGVKMAEIVTELVQGWTQTRQISGKGRN